MRKTKSTLCCRNVEQTFNINEIRNIRILKKGHEGINVYTIHYKVVILFNDRTHISILETGDRHKARRQTYAIKTFLNGYCEDKELEIIDESTTL